MANKKLVKLRREKQKVHEKIMELQELEADLDRQIEQQEDLDIVGIVRAEGLTLDEFAELMKQLKDNPLPARPQD